MAKKRALIIEDNKEIGEIYKMTLGLADYDADYIPDGKEGLERLESSAEHYNLVILDMNLPQISGHYIYKTIRADPKFAHMTVIISTANNLVAKALEEELGPNDILLVKPVSPRQIKDILERM